MQSKTKKQNSNDLKKWWC